jgi:hypothetical protein
VHLRRPRGLGRIPAFCQGFVGGLTTHVDRANLRYELRRDGYARSRCGSSSSTPSWPN